MSQVQQLNQPRDKEEPARAKPAPLFEVRNLSVNYSKETGLFGQGKRKLMQAVENVSFDLFPSETLSLVGESGSGKTTIAKCVVGLLNPSTGVMKYNGEEITELTGKRLRDFRRDVQIVFQDPFGSLDPFHDVKTIVSIPLMRLLGMRKKSKIEETVNSLLEEVGLDPADTAYKLAHELSGGERQRVNIARALATRPRILVADEPVSMLDASQRLNVLSLLKSLQLKRDLSILMITHDLAVSRVMGGRIMIMHSGSIVETGETEAILRSPENPYTKLLISASPRIGSEATPPETP